MPVPPPELSPPPAAPPASSAEGAAFISTWVNTSLIVVCVVVALFSSLGHETARLRPLFISAWPASSPDALSEVRHGEVWRLFTPIFIHFGVAHIILNMMAMGGLGGPLEQVQGTRFYVVFTALIALCSNLAQYAVSGSAAFGGMSGVIFGMFGFLWARPWFDRRYELHLERPGVITTLAWFAFCFTGVLPIANTAHAVGLGMGVAWGVISGLAARRQVAPETAPAP